MTDLVIWLILAGLIVLVIQIFGWNYVLLSIGCILGWGLRGWFDHNNND